MTRIGRILADKIKIRGLSDASPCRNGVRRTLAFCVFGSYNEAMSNHCEAISVHLTQAELEGQVRLMAALKMFELGKLSSGKVAELAGVSRVEFFDLCGRYHGTPYFIVVSRCSCQELSLFNP